MYKKILIPTDGSDLSNATAIAGVEFAAQIGAEVAGLFVAPECQYAVYGEIIPSAYPAEDEYRASMAKTGQACLQIIDNAAQKAKLAFTGMTLFSDATARCIVETAKNTHCDLISMGSHGRGGWGHLLLGSVTSSVLAECTVPVLVHRIKKPANPLI